MKKTIALLLGLMLVVAFSVVACGSSGIDWSLAGDHEGEEVTITGVVGGINNLFEEKGIAKATIFLGGASKAEEHFNVTIVLNPDGTWPEYMSDLEGQYNDELIGKTMEVTGTVSLNSFESAFEIIVNPDPTNPDSVLPGPEASATWEIK